MMDRLDQLEDPTVRRAAQTYLVALDTVLAPRRRSVRADVRAGVEAHLLEALNHDPAAGEAKLAAVLKALGDPVEFAFDWADAVEAQHPQGQAERAARFIRRNARQVGQIALGCVGVLIGFAGLAGVIGRLTHPQTVGVFRLVDGEIFIGTWTRYYAAIERDLLGGLTVPISLVFACGGFALAWFARPADPKK